MKDKADLEELDDAYKYARIGYVNMGRKSDAVLTAILSVLPGDGRLPRRWHYRSQELFQKNHGHLGVVLWSPASSSHLLMIGGTKAARVWTDATRHCYVDISDTLANFLHNADFCVIQDIPQGCAKKCQPFSKRIKIWQKHQALSLVDAIKRIYGLDSKRLPVPVWT